MSDLRILTMDPGTSNFAVSVIRTRWRDGKFSVKVEGSFMLDPQLLLKDMKTMRASLNIFLDYVEPLFDNGTFDAFVAERFQARGGKGPTIESVNCMLGGMAVLSADIDNADFVTAGVWKNEFNRHADLKEMYLDLAALAKEFRGIREKKVIKIHQLDSILLGIYRACKIYGIKPFHFINTREREEKLLSILAFSPTLSFMPPHLPKIRKAKRGKRK